MGSRTYFDSAMFRQLLIDLMGHHQIPPQEPERLARIVNAATGFPVTGDQIAACCTGDADCPVALFFAICEALEVPGGMLHWFGPAFRPQTIARLHRLRQMYEPPEREC